LKASRIACTPKNKAATVNKFLVKDDFGCEYILSFKIRKGKGYLINGEIDCSDSKEATKLTSTTTTGKSLLTETTKSTLAITETSEKPGNSEVPSLNCGCSCDCPEDGSDCACTCDCPRALVTAPPRCAQGFVKICPMKSPVCPENSREVCPPNAQRPQQPNTNEITDRKLTVAAKSVMIGERTYKCSISISHGCVTTLTTTIKCSPGKPKARGTLQFSKDGYTFLVEFQTPSKVIKTELIGVPCPKCSCKSSLCDPPCPTKGSASTITTSTKATEKFERNSTTNSAETTEEKVHTTTNTPESTTPQAEATEGITTEYPPKNNRWGTDDGCSCVPNFMLFFSERFMMQKNYQDNGFLASCFCIEEDDI